jgi:hypothetical protein
MSAPSSRRFLTSWNGRGGSRSAVLAATGQLGTGAFEIWKSALESDLKTAQALAREVPDADETYQRSKHQNLETKLVEVHALAKQAGLGPLCRTRDYTRSACRLGVASQRVRVSQ